MSLSPSLIKSIGKTSGFNVREEVATSLTSDVEYRLREIIQEALKFMKHSKRNKLTTEDMNQALRLRNVESLYGFSSSKEPLHFSKMITSTSANTKDVKFVIDDKLLSFDEIINSPLPKCPLEPSLSIHWLAIEGVQPFTPQNPIISPSSKEVSKKKAGNNTKVVPLVKHVLSKELQLYFEKVTSTIREKDKEKTNAVLERLSDDSGIHQLLPYFTQFIVDEVTANIRNREMLFTLMRMIRSLLESSYLHVELYLHQLMPAVLTCLVGKRLCESSEEDHWSLRDYSAGLIRLICEKFGSAYKNIPSRISKTLIQALSDSSKPLTTHYGAIVGLDALGHSVVGLLLIPQVKQYLSKLDPQSSSEAKKVYQALLKCVGNYLYQVAKEDRPETEATESNLEQWKQSFLDHKGEIDFQEIFQLFGESLLPYLRPQDQYPVLL